MRSSRSTCVYSVCTLYGVSLKFSFRIRIGKTDDVNMSLKRFLSLSLWLVGEKKQRNQESECETFGASLTSCCSHTTQKILLLLFLLLLLLLNGRESSSLKGQMLQFSEIKKRKQNKTKQNREESKWDFLLLFFFVFAPQQLQSKLLLAQCDVSVQFKGFFHKLKKKPHKDPIKKKTTIRSSPWTWSDRRLCLWRHF